MGMNTCRVFLHTFSWNAKVSSTNVERGTLKLEGKHHVTRKRMCVTHVDTAIFVHLSDSHRRAALTWARRTLLRLGARHLFGSYDLLQITSVQIRHESVPKHGGSNVSSGSVNHRR